MAEIEDLERLNKVFEMSAMKKLMTKSFLERTISGILLVIIALAAIIYGGQVLHGDILLGTMICISLIGCFEFLRVYKMQWKVPGYIVYLATIAYYLMVRFEQTEYLMALFIAVMILLMAVYVFTFPKYKADEMMITYFCLFYVSLMLSYIYQVRMMPDGAYIVWLIFLCSWGCDTCAYLVGVMFGKHKMAPVLSPKKSIEGAVGGVVGAALATVISRFVELIYIAAWAHTHASAVPFAAGAFRSLYVPADLTISCIQKGTPLLLNEALWSGGQAMLTQCYSVRGLSVVSAFNISQTLANVFNVAFIAMGSATAIIIGQKLGEWGESRVRELKDEAWRLTYFAVFLCLISASLMLALSGLFPMIYNTTGEIRALATGLICVAACFMPMHAFNNASYFIIRSGGKTFITFLFDSVFCWAASIPAAYFLAHYTQVPIIPMYAAVCSVELVKVVIGRILVNKGIWIRDITV